MIIGLNQLDLTTGEIVELYALLADEPTLECHIYSLLYEGYRSDWTTSRESLEAVK